MSRNLNQFLRGRAADNLSAALRARSVTTSGWNRFDEDEEEGAEKVETTVVALPEESSEEPVTPEPAGESAPAEEAKTE